MSDDERGLVVLPSSPLAVQDPPATVTLEDGQHGRERERHHHETPGELPLQRQLTVAIAATTHTLPAATRRNSSGPTHRKRCS